MEGTYKNWTVEQIIEATGGGVSGSDPGRSFSGISIDSRTISPNDIFVAIKGDVFDGHDFIDDVVQKGVKGVVVCFAEDRVKASVGKDVVCITVNDTVKALADLAFYKRTHSRADVIAVTGSNGKTTTKEMTAKVTSSMFSTLSTMGNLNNEIGLPLSLLKLEDHHEWAVLELGMNHPGEIRRLARICTPDIGVITNVGPAHLEGVGSLEGVMRAKGELLEEMAQDGVAILNADDEFGLKLAESTDRKTILFGRSEKADIRATSIRTGQGGIDFDLMTPGGKISIRLPAIGDFMVSNALAAAAAGVAIGIDLENIRTALENFSPVRGRMNIVCTGEGVHIIDDTYNANPGSVAAAIRTLRDLKKDRRGILIIGDMKELGKHSEPLHREIGSIAAQNGIDKIYAAGEYAQSVRDGAIAHNLPPENAGVGTWEEIVEHVSKIIRPGDWILVKGSRAMGMERVVQALTDR